MSNTFQCGDNTGLVAYLYDECEPGEREAIDAHIGLCAACAAEVAALESARVQLSSWTPPETDLGFAIVRPQAPGIRAQGLVRPEVSDGSEPVGLKPGPWFARPLPAWAQFVAACLIFGAGLSLGVLRGTSTRPASPTQVATASAPAAAVTASDLAALEQRLRSEMTELRATPARVVASGGPQGAELLTQVRMLIEESEQRQQRELALRTAQVVRDFDSQRRVDLAQIQRNFGQIEGVTGAEVREQRQMLNYLLRVSESDNR